MKKKRVDSFRDPEKLCKQKQESFEALKGRERQKKSEQARRPLSVLPSLSL